MLRILTVKCEKKTELHRIEAGLQRAKMDSRSCTINLNYSQFHSST